MRDAAHTFLSWVPGAAIAGILAVVALGGESVRAKIWDAILAIWNDPVSLTTAFVIVIAWTAAWWWT